MIYITAQNVRYFKSKGKILITLSREDYIYTSPGGDSTQVMIEIEPKLKH